MADVEAVRQFFAKRHILLQNEWETEALRYLKLNAAKNNPGVVLDIPELMFDQWLHSDLVESTIPQLKVPPNARKLTLAKPEIVQLCSVTDISESAYSQYRSQVIDLSKDDADFCDPTEAAAVEKVHPRNFNSMLMLEVSDGQTTLKATVTKHIQGIGLTTLPGTKLLLIPRIVCRRRCFILTAENCQILGGSCERLLEENYPTMKLLCRRLQLDYREALDKINKMNMCMRQTVIGKPPPPKVQPKPKPKQPQPVAAFPPPPMPQAVPIPVLQPQNALPLPVPVFRAPSKPNQPPVPARIQPNPIPCRQSVPAPSYPPSRSCFQSMPAPSSAPGPLQQPVSNPPYQQPWQNPQSAPGHFQQPVRPPPCQQPWQNTQSAPTPFQNPQMAPNPTLLPPPISAYGRDRDDSGFNDGYQQPSDSNYGEPSFHVSASFSSDDPDESFVDPPPMPDYAFLRRRVAPAPHVAPKPPPQSWNQAVLDSNANEEPQPERLLSFFAKKKPKAASKPPKKPKPEPASQSKASVVSDRDNDGFLKPSLPSRWKSTKTLVATECVPETPANVVKKIKTSDPSLQSAGPMDKFLQKMPPEPMMIIPPTPDVTSSSKSKWNTSSFARPQMPAPPAKSDIKYGFKDLSTFVAPPEPEFKKPLPPVAPVRNVHLPNSPPKVARKDALLKENLPKSRFRDTTFDDDDGFDVTQEIGFRNPQRRKPNDPNQSATFNNNEFDFEAPAKAKAPPLMTQDMISFDSTMNTTFDYNMTQPDITIDKPLSPMKPMPEDPSLYIPRSIVPTKTAALETPRPVSTPSIVPEEIASVGNASFHTPEKKRPLPPKTPLRTKMIVKDADSPLSNDESTDSRERTPSPKPSASRGVKRTDPGLFSPPKVHLQPYGALAPLKRERDTSDAARSTSRSPGNPKRRLDFSVLQITPPSERRLNQTSPFGGFIGDNFFSPKKATTLRSKPPTPTFSFTQGSLSTSQTSETSLVERYKGLRIDLLADIREERKYWASSEIRVIQPIRCKPSNSLTVRNGIWVFDVEVSDTSAEGVRMRVDSGYIDRTLGFTADYVKTVREEKNVAELTRCKDKGSEFTRILSKCHKLAFHVLFPPSGPDLPVVMKLAMIPQSLKFV
uniref:RecQ-mediated genome instability protein 1 n=1 Tax=Panagrellus redivivus TaxID=6233 RepID=A0A7E4ZYK1_PANRE